MQVYTAKLAESINTLDGGLVTGVTVPDVVVHTFSGKVRGRSTTFLSLLSLHLFLV